MERTQLGFLNARDASQQLISSVEVVSTRGLFRQFEHATSVQQFRHHVPGITSRFDADNELILVSRPRDTWRKCRSAAPRWQGATSENIEHI